MTGVQTCALPISPRAPSEPGWGVGPSRPPSSIRAGVAGAGTGQSPAPGGTSAETGAPGRPGALSFGSSLQTDDSALPLWRAPQGVGLLGQRGGGPSYPAVEGGTRGRAVSGASAAQPPNRASARSRPGLPSLPRPRGGRPRLPAGPLPTSGDDGRLAFRPSSLWGASTLHRGRGAGRPRFPIFPSNFCSSAGSGHGPRLPLLPSARYRGGLSRGLRALGRGGGRVLRGRPGRGA